MEQNIELLGNIVENIINQEDFLEDNPNFNWTEFSFVIDVNEEGAASGNFGYAYDSNGNFSAESINSRALRPSIKNYRDWLSKDTGEGFIKILIQFNRNSGRVQADFEYDDEDRWKVTPNNVDQIIEELRPNLGS